MPDDRAPSGLPVEAADHPGRADLRAGNRPAGTDPFAPVGSPDGSPARRPGTAARPRLATTGTRRGASARAAATPPPPPQLPPQLPSQLPPYVLPAPAPEPPPEPAAARKRLPRSLVGVAVVGTLLVSVGGAALLRGAQDDVAAARPETSQSDPAFPAPPVPLGVDSEFIDTEVLDGGDLLVSHWIRTSQPVTELVVDVPPSSGFTADTINVLDLTVVTPGRVAESPARQSGGGWASALPGAVREVYVRYRLSGVLQRSASAAGRALAPMTSLSLGVDGQLLARTQTFSGLEVLTLACLSAEPRATPTLCGALVDDTWTVDSAADAVPAIVIAQLDLQASPVGR